MELTEHGQQHPNLITLSKSGWRDNKGQIYQQSIIVPWDQPIVPVDVKTVQDLNPQLIKQLCDYQPEIIILATGEHIDYPATDLLTPLVEQNIGLEVMTNTAAARTLNVLMSEGRQALCLFIISD